jgi:hypothetical protein
VTGEPAAQDTSERARAARSAFMVGLLYLVAATERLDEVEAGRRARATLF